MAITLTKEYKYWRYRIFSLTWLAYAGFYLCRKNFSIAMPLLSQDQGFTVDNFAMFLGLYSFFYAAGQFYNGFLSDKFGPRLIVGIGLFVSILANIFMGFSAALLVFGLWWCINGIGQSTGWSGTVKNMAPWFRRQERGVVMSWWATCYVIGAIIATALATFIVTHPLLLRANDLKDPSGLAIQLSDERNSLSNYLREQFSTESQQLLSAYDGTGPVPETLLQAMVSEFNTVLQGPWLYDKQRFAGIQLSDRTTKNIENLIAKTPEQRKKELKGKKCTSFNKILLEETYPQKFKLKWRRSFWVPSAVLTLIALSFITFTRNRPSDAGLPEIAEDGTYDSESAENVKNNTKLSSIEILAVVLKNPIVWIISIMYFFTKMGRYALLFWLPLYMVEHLGYSLAEAGYTSILYEGVGFAGVIAAGYVSDKLFQARRMPVGALGMWGLAITCFFHPQLAAWSHLGNAIGISLIGFFTYGPDALMSGAAAIDACSPKAAGLASGVINGVGSIGQIASGFIVAFIASKYGWDNLFYFFVVISFIAGCLLALKWNWIPEAHKQVSENNSDSI
ncbi:MAG: MFS transporter [Sedimentisphaerales bacterium]|nr:MFS transporter [Sedimentisphaerales bacterium]